MENLGRIFFSNFSGETGYLDILSGQELVYNIPFTVSNTKGGSFNVDNTTTVHLQPNQIALVLGETISDGITYIASQYAGGSFAADNVATEIPATFSISQYFVRSLQFSYYTPSLYQGYCENRGTNVPDEKCTFKTLTGSQTITIKNPGNLFTDSNPGAMIPFTQTQETVITWWVILLFGIGAAVVLFLIIAVGAYSFRKYKQRYSSDNKWDPTV